jgi:isopenicillin-N epimerase
VVKYGMQFGRAMMGEFLLDPAFIHLNNGSYGATPRVVAAAAEGWRRRMEAEPTGFFRALGGELRRAAGLIARVAGGRGEDWVFVDNATTGVNAVLFSLALAPGEKILTTSQSYRAVANAMVHHARRAGAEVVEVALPVPVPGPDEVVAAIAAGLARGRVRLAVVDHVTSPTAAVLPVAEIAAACRQAGAALLVDGAHAPGMLALDVPAIGCDWYVGNAHKWMFAPRGCGLLWTSPARAAQTHPTVISHGAGRGLTAEFDWTGTRDPSPWLALEAAIAFMEGLGAAAVRSHNRTLALAAADLLAGAFATGPAAPPAMTGSMVSVRLPPAAGTDHDAAGRVFMALAGRRIVAPVHALAGALWVRVSAQVYNDLDDVRMLRQALLEILA